MKNRILLSFYFTAIFFTTFAQTTNPAGSKEIDISKTVFIQEAKKLGIPIQIEKIKVQDPVYEYNIFPKLFQVNPYYSEPIQAISLGEIKLPELLNSYAVLGFGNYRNAVADFYYSSKRDRNKSYDLRFQHQSGKAPARYSGFGNTALTLNGERIYQKHTMKLSVNMGYRRVHHYGFYSDSIPDSININPDTIKTDYLNLAIDFRYNNYKSQIEKHKYEAYILPYFYKSSNLEYEWATVAGGNLIEPLNENAHLSFDLEYDYNAYYMIEGDWLRNIVRVGANYNLSKGDLKIKAGFKTASDNVYPPGETAASQNSIYFFPDISARYGFAKNLIVAYANIGGGLKKNSFKSISEINPFITSSINLQNTVERINIAGGLKGTLTKELNYHAYVGYRNMDKMLLFVNLDTALNYFQPIYSGTNTGILQTGAELHYRQNERLLLHAKGNYYQYSFINNSAWNLPTFDLKLTSTYNFQDKILINANVFAINSRLGTTVLKATNFEMKGAVDLGLGVDYQFNSKTYVYLKLNNLLNKKYMMWNGYPVQGFNLMAGLKIQF